MVITDEITVGGYSKDNRTDLNCQTLFAAIDHWPLTTELRLRRAAPEFPGGANPAQPQPVAHQLPDMEGC